MSKFEMAEKANPEEAVAQPAAFMSEMHQHRDLLKTAGGTDKVQAPGDKGPAEPTVEMSPAAVMMDATMTAAQKEVQERKAKNGTITPEDLKEILPKYFPKMKEAITLSDQTAATARKEAEEAYKVAKPAFETYPTELPKASQRLFAAAQAVPEAERAKVEPVLKEFIDEKATPERKAEIRKELAKYPDLIDSIEAVDTLQKDMSAKLEKLSTAVGTMQNSLAESLMMRGMYKGSLEAANGDMAESQRVEKEAAIVQELYKKAMTNPEVLFVDPTDLAPKKPLPPLRSA